MAAAPADTAVSGTRPVDPAAAASAVGTVGRDGAAGAGGGGAGCATDAAQILTPWRVQRSRSGCAGSASSASSSATAQSGAASVAVTWADAAAAASAAGGAAVVGGAYTSSSSPGFAGERELGGEDLGDLLRRERPLHLLPRRRVAHQVHARGRPARHHRAILDHHLVVRRAHREPRGELRRKRRPRRLPRRPEPVGRRFEDEVDAPLLGCEPPPPRHAPCAFCMAADAPPASDQAARASRPLPEVTVSMVSLRKLRQRAESIVRSACAASTSSASQGRDGVSRGSRN